VPLRDLGHPRHLRLAVWTKQKDPRTRWS
jgi:hypothetical protein